MAKVREAITVDCRTPEEYYEAKKMYERDNYTICESPNPRVLQFVAKKEKTIFEYNSPGHRRL